MKTIVIGLLTTTCLVMPAVAPAQTPAQSETSEDAQRAEQIDEDPAPKPVESSSEIVVTGTRITRPNMISAAPITTVTLQSIQAQAPVNVEEVLNRLPQIAPDSQQNYQDSDGRQRIKLRSLGFERTLVLIDGKRLGTQNGQDTNIIPTSLLQRVDLLTGGASSVYGSDAVAGVVNFVLRQDFEGVRIDANYDFYNHINRDTIVSPVARASGFSSPTGATNDGGRANLTLTAGTKLLSGALKISGFVNYRAGSVVPYGARSSSACQLVQTGRDGPLSCSLSTYSPSGYISPRSGANSGNAYVNNPDGTRNFVPFGVGAGNAANPYDGYSYQRRFERYNAGGFASLELSRDVELYGSAIWFKDTSSNRFPARVYSYTAYGSTPYRVNCDNPYLSAGQASTLCGAQAGTSEMVPLDVRYRFDGLPQVLDTYENSAIRVTGGLRGQVGPAWTYDIGAVYARNQQATRYGNYPDYDRVNRSLNVVNVNGTPTCASVVSGADPTCIPFDAFSAGNTSSALANYLFAGQYGEGVGRGILHDVIGSVSGDLGSYGVKSPWSERGVAVSLATEYREERYVSTADATFREQVGGSDVDVSQDVWESNIEIQAPLIENKRWAHLLQVNGGYRVSKYSNNPETFSTWKAEGLFAPIADLTLRASFNKAQRAPTVIESVQATNISFSRQGGSQNDFCAPVARQIQDPADPTKTITTTAPLASREVCRATGLSDSLYGSATLLCPDNQCTVRSGGFTADPETAYTQTYGLILRPRFLKTFFFSIDRFRIKIDNSLGYNDYSYYTNGCVDSNGDPFFCLGIVRQPGSGILYASAADNPTSGFIRQGTTNYYLSISRGWDFQTSYTLGLGGRGSIGWDFNGSYTDFAGGQDSPVQPRRNCAGYYGNGCGQLIPKWSHGLRTNYATADGVFNASFNWRYVGRLTHADNSGDPAIGGTSDRVRTSFARIDPVSYFDLALTVAVAKAFTFRVTANNLLDKAAPIIANSYDISLARNNTIPQRYDSLGRTISVGTSVRF